jgi:hypothetical protein
MLLLRQVLVNLRGTLSSRLRYVSIYIGHLSTFLEFTWILGQQAINILVKQEPPRGNYPNGGFHSSSTVEEEFFTPEAKEEHERQLTVHHMPFLYGMLMGMLKRAGCQGSIDEEEEVAFPSDATATAVAMDPEISIDPLIVPEDVSNIFYELVPSQDCFHQRSQRVSVPLSYFLIGQTHIQKFAVPDCYDCYLHVGVCSEPSSKRPSAP